MLFELFDKSGIRSGKRCFWFLVLICFGIGLFLRLYRISEPSTFRDEYKVYYSLQAQNVGDAITLFDSFDTNPFLGIVILFYARKVFPTLEALRVLGAVVSSFIIPAFAWFLLPYIGKRKSLLLAILATFSYQLVYFSRFIRPYQYCFFLMLLSIGFFIRILMSGQESPRKSHLWGFALSSLLCFYLQYTVTILWCFMFMAYLCFEVWHWRNCGMLRVILARRLLLLACLLLLAILPNLHAFYSKGMAHALGPNKIPFDLSLIFKSYMSAGFGFGWQGYIFVCLVLLGLWRLNVENKTLFFLVTVTMLAPPIVLMLWGMPLIFYFWIVKYYFPLVVGFLVLIVYAVNYLAEISVLKSKLKVYPGVVAPFLLIFVYSVMLPNYAKFYQLSATGYQFRDLGRLLSIMGPRMLLSDNVYDGMYIDHYLPKNTVLHSTPPFGSREQYSKWNIPEYVQSILFSNPLVVFHDSHMRDVMGSAPEKWRWLDRVFIHKVELRNPEAEYLNDRGLNYYGEVNDLEGRQWPETAHTDFYFNNPEELPAVYERLGFSKGCALLTGWRSMLHLNLKREADLVTVLDTNAAFYVYVRNPGKYRLNLSAYTCSETNLLFVTSAHNKQTQLGTINGTIVRVENSDASKRAESIVPIGDIAQGCILKDRLHAYNQLFMDAPCYSVPYTNISAQIYVMENGNNYFELHHIAKPWHLVLKSISLERVK